MLYELSIQYVMSPTLLALQASPSKFTARPCWTGAVQDTAGVTILAVATLVLTALAIPAWQTVYKQHANIGYDKYIQSKTTR